MRRLFWALALLWASASALTAADVDWKWYGGVSISVQGEVLCFYDEKGIARPSPNIVRVWTKCLPQKELDNVPQTAPYWRAFIDMSASRIGHYYYPPIFRVERIRDAKQVQSVIIYETIADVSGIESNSELFYELDCTQRKIHELHISVGTSSTDVPTDWKNVPPEGNAANLIALLCPASGR